MCSFIRKAYSSASRDWGDEEVWSRIWTNHDSEKIGKEKTKKNKTKRNAYTSRSFFMDDAGLEPVTPHK